MAGLDVAVAGLGVAAVGLGVASAGLGVTAAGLDVSAAELDVTSAGLDVTSAELDVSPELLRIFLHFTNIAKGEKNTPKTHKALYLRAFCGCGGCQGRDVKIFLSGLDRLADSRKVVAVNVNYDC